MRFTVEYGPVGSLGVLDRITVDRWDQATQIGEEILTGFASDYISVDWDKRVARFTVANGTAAYALGDRDELTLSYPATLIESTLTEAARPEVIATGRRVVDDNRGLFERLEAE